LSLIEKWNSYVLPIYPSLTPSFPTKEINR
jgi:folate-dependent phosphoribosylglycinamide formyltransferase PurN